MRNRTGWAKVLFVQARAQDVFIRVSVNGHSVEVTPTHPFEALDENCMPLECVRSANLTLLHQLYTSEGADFVQALQVVKNPHGQKMLIHCDGDHTFFSGETTPYILVHNNNSSS